MADDQRKKIQHAALSVTRWVGSPQSIFVHSVLFIGSFLSAYFGFVSFDRMLLTLTTLVSLEAIYLSIFIQISINSANEAIGAVEQDIDEIQEDVEKIEKDVDEIQEDVDEIQEDVEGIEKDVDEIQEDVEDMTEEEQEEAKKEKNDESTLVEIHKNLKKLMEEVESLQHKK